MNEMSPKRALTGRVRSTWLLAAAATGALAAYALAAPGPPPVGPIAPGEAAADSPQPGAPLGLDTFKDVAARYDAGVVNINTSAVVEGPAHAPDMLRDFFGDDLFDRFFGADGGDSERRTRRSLGSGFVIDEEGHILTNRHVVEGADEIQVIFADGDQYEAELVGRDARTDVALLRIEPEEDLTVLELGDSASAEVGEWVMAIGNPFGLRGNSVTVGVVSFNGRDLRLGAQGTSVPMIQTDASINPGNSGGPLIDAHGEVVGINTMIIAGGAAQSAGVGFAVPIEVARDILPQLEAEGRVDRGWLGVAIQPVTDDLARTLGMDEAAGTIVSDVTPGSPADEAGLVPGDVILAVDGERFDETPALSSRIAGLSPGTTVELRVLHEGAERTLDVKLGTFPQREEPAQTARAGGGVLGMELRELTPALADRLGLESGVSGVAIADVEAGSAAADAGVQAGDVVVSVNGTAVASASELRAQIDAARERGLARLRVARGGGYAFVVLEIP